MATSSLHSRARNRLPASSGVTALQQRVEGQRHERGAQCDLVEVVQVDQVEGGVQVEGQQHQRRPALIGAARQPEDRQARGGQRQGLHGQQRAHVRPQPIERGHQKQNGRQVVAHEVVGILQSVGEGLAVGGAPDDLVEVAQVERMGEKAVVQAPGQPGEHHKVCRGQNVSAQPQERATDAVLAAGSLAPRRCPAVNCDSPPFRPPRPGSARFRTPTACSAAILSAALPDPPDTMAPAWPIRLSAGAVCPAISAVTGLLISVAINEAACFLFRAADLADQHHLLGRAGRPRTGAEPPRIGAGNRVAADAERGGLADAALGQFVDDLVGQGAAA